MKTRNALICLLLFATAACGQRDDSTAAVPAPAAALPEASGVVPASDAMATFVFAVPGEAVNALRFDPTSLVGEEVRIRRIALVGADGTVAEMDACAPRNVQRVRIASFTRTGDDCSIVFGVDGNPGWMGLSAFGSLEASASARHVEMDMALPAGGQGPFLLFDTGRGYNFEQRVRGEPRGGAQD